MPRIFDNLDQDSKLLAGYLVFGLQKLEQA